MTDKRCAECCMLCPEEELLVREDDGRLVCPDCSGINEEDKQSCDFDETG